LLWEGTAWWCWRPGTESENNNEILCAFYKCVVRLFYVLCFVTQYNCINKYFLTSEWSNAQQNFFAEKFKLLHFKGIINKVVNNIKIKENKKKKKKKNKRHKKKIIKDQQDDKKKKKNKKKTKKKKNKGKKKKKEREIDLVFIKNLIIKRPLFQ
jgi:hypothetical protein